MIRIDLLRGDARANLVREQLQKRRDYERRWRAAYKQTEHGRAVILAAQEKFRRSDKRAAWLKAWRKHPDVASKAAARDLARKERGDPSLRRSKEKYWLSEKGKASVRAWRKSPAGLAWKKSGKRVAWEKAYSKSETERERTRLKARGPKHKEADRAYIRSDAGKMMNQRRFHRRRAALRGVPSDFTKEQWGALQVAYGGCCAYCHQKRPLTQDHVLAVTRGGHDTLENVVPACKPCNSRKRDIDIASAFKMLGVVDADAFWARHEAAVIRVRSEFP